MGLVRYPSALHWERGGFFQVVGKKLYFDAWYKQFVVMSSF